MCFFRKFYGLKCNSKVREVLFIFNISHFQNVSNLFLEIYYRHHSSAVLKFPLFFSHFQQKSSFSNSLISIKFETFVFCFQNFSNLLLIRFKYIK